MPLLHIYETEQKQSEPTLPGADFPIEELLHQLSFERQRARRRETIYISIILHICLLFVLFLNPKFLHSSSSPVQPPDIEPQQLTYLEMPKDLITPKKPIHPPPVISDQNRHFEHPQPPKDSISQPAQPRPAPPAPNPPAPPAPAVTNPNTASPPPAPQPAPPPPKADDGLRLQNVPSPLRPNLPLGQSVADQLQQAIRDAAQNAAHGHGLSEMTPAPPPPGGHGSPGQLGAGVQILTDTQGVDFDAYLRRVVDTVRTNWYTVMPEAVYLGRKGRVVIIFNIENTGNVPGLNLTSGSGTESLDEAAQAAIRLSNPFPPLPSQFHGPYITLQFSFYYNLEPGDDH